MHDQLNHSSASVTTYRLEGQTVDWETGFGVGDLRVDLIDFDNLCTDLVAHAKTDAQGHFSIKLDKEYLDSLFFGRIPTLAFRVYVYGTGPSEVREKFTDPVETWTPSTTPTRFRIALDMDEERIVASPAVCAVRGRLTDTAGEPLEEYTVKAYDKGLTDDTTLGTSTTDGNGWYHIEYGPAELNRPGKIHPDLIVRAFEPEDEEEENPIAEVGEICHAPTTVTVNLVKENIAYRGRSEESRIEGHISAAIGEEEIEPKDLTEDQISFIACSTQTDRDLVATYVKAAEIVAEGALTVPAGAVYSLLRQGFPATHRGILAHRPAVIRDALERSITENILPADATAALDEIVEGFTAGMVDLAKAAREGGGTGLGDVVATVLSDPDDQELFIEEFLTHEGTVEEFWTAIASATGFTTTPDFAKLKRTMQWGALARYHAPLVEKLESLWENEGPDELTSVRDVARYDEDGWKAILDTEVESVAIGCPPDIPGTDTTAKRLNFAKVLERSVETAFPTAVIAAGITRDDDEDDADLITFFANNPDFEFATTRVSTYLATHTEAMTGISTVPDSETGLTDVDITTRRLKSMARIFRLTRRYPDMKILLNAGLHSSQSIHRMGRTRFLAQFGEALGIENAERIFGRACWFASTAAALYTKYGAQLNSLQIFSLPDLVTPGEPPAVIADWATLFGSPDACECKHCRSVYSPAAYLVDLLEFLDRQDSKIETSVSDVYFSARDVLIGYFGTDANEPAARRPDIANILLSCENTDTTLPYIDLVNEILEVAVANHVDDPDHLWPTEIASNNNAAELLAEPEIVHPTARNVAYSELASAVYPFEMPFHFWEDEARIYLDHLGTPRISLIETFLVPKKEPDSNIANLIAQERLRLSVRAWDVLCDNEISGLNPNHFWAMPAGATWWLGSTDPVVAGLDEVPQFLNRSGLSFDELRELLATDFLDGDVALDPATGCDIDAKSLTGLTDTILGRIHRFLRLRKCLGLTITEVDWIMTSFGLTDIDDESLQTIADAVTLQRDLDVPLEMALSFWKPMVTRSYEGKTSLYEQLFLTKAISQFDDQFALVPGNTASGTIMDHAVGVLLALRIKLEELGLIMVEDVAEAVMGLPNVIGTNALLTLENVSRLHRIVAFARALRLSISEFLVLRELSGMDVLTADDPGESPDPAEPAGTRAFVTLLNKLRGAGLKVADVHYIARHVSPPAATMGPSEATITKIVSELEADIAKVVEQTAFASDPEGSLTRERLVELIAGETAEERETNAEEVMAILAGTSAATGEDQRDFIELHLESFFGEHTADALDNLVGPLEGVPPVVGEPLLDTPVERFDYVLKHVLDYVCKTRVETVVTQRLAKETKIGLDVAGQLLTATLRSFFETSSPAIVDFYPEFLTVEPASAASTANRLSAVTRFAKAAFVVQKLKLGVPELAWLYREGADPEWLDLNDLPLERDDTANDYRARFADIVRLVEFAAVRDEFDDGAEALLSILAVAKQVADAAVTATVFYDEIAARVGMGFTGSDVETLSDTHFGYIFVPEVDPVKEADFLDEKAIGNIVRALKTLHRVGASVTEGITWATLDITLPVTAEPAVSSDIKHKARAKYEDAQWPSVVRPLRDALREKQRNTLVKYLISADDEIESSNDLFAKLLIDVEMSPCQLTSRIKQAISSVQTFVQRSFLHLEADVELGEDAAREWEWMKSYRVWEANRKVFLYPENWIEPELRDDKTPFFQAMESSLLQGDINAESAERAYVKYLEELHGVARLDIAAMCHQREDDADGKGVDIVHVIGRTHATPHRYYYRKRVNSSYWTPWERIDVEIQGDHLLATVWNRRLYLFWLLFNDIVDSKDTKALQIRIAWTHRDSQGFAGAQTSGDETTDFPAASATPQLISLATSTDSSRLSIDVFLFAHPGGVPKYLWNRSFVLDPCTGEMKLVYRAPDYLSGWLPFETNSQYMHFVEKLDSEKPDIGDLKEYLRLPADNGSSPWLMPVQVLKETPGQFALLIDRTQTNVFAGKAERIPMVYQDQQRAFFVDRPWRVTAPWKDAAAAYPNMPVPVAKDVSGGPEPLEPVVIEWANAPKLDMSLDYTIERLYRFHTLYHPYVCEFMGRLQRDGIDGLLRWSSGAETALQLLAKTDVSIEYVPTAHVYDPFPIENVDFSFGGAYSQYNWELFFHAPFLIATRLTKNSRFEDADKWYRYIFDPTGGAPGTGPERFWNVRPFRENIDLASIQSQLEALSANNPHAEVLKDLFGLDGDGQGATDIAAQIARWRETPFNPHLIARMRILSYQKAVVMKYVENLLEWGDSLFRRDTMESINEATQLYILASQILGQRPRLVKTDDIDPQTYAQLEPNVDAFSNALVEIESIAPEPPDSNVRCTRGQPPPVLHTLYFCVPHNEKMLALWDRVKDRLLKVRCCMNIDGVVRQLPLFEAPLDPALLVKAAAGGLDLGEVLADVYAPLPIYRFSALMPKAMDFSGSVVAMGNALLSALEKRDGEALSRLRATHETDMLTRVRDVRKRQIDEAREALEGLKKSRAVIEERRRFYTEIEDRIAEENEHLQLTSKASQNTRIAQSLQQMATVLRLIPQFSAGTNTSIEFGGVQLGGVADAFSQFYSIEATSLGAKASLAGTEAGYKRRAADWGLQKTLAEKELEQIDRQIVAAEIRLEIAQNELHNHDQSLKNAKEVEDYLRTKYTREELYEWLVTKVKEVYFQAYKLAYGLAKRVERTYQFELARPDETFLAPSYWESTNDGLMAGERLQLDLRRMEAAYLEQNRREFEMTKHVSLAEVEPKELLKLRETGACNVVLPEAVFDLDWPGHYLRRIKSVSLSIPVVNAPYAGVNCKLTLQKNFVRKSGASGGTYPRSSDLDPRFVSYQVPMQSIITSSAQQDGGLFELVFRDERYLPFEGAGADSKWEIALDPATNRFNPTDAKDVILHIRYTAREGQSALKTAAVAALEANDGPVGSRLFSAKADFPAEWAVFTAGEDDPDQQTLTLPFVTHHFQPLRGRHTLEITSISIFTKWRDEDIEGDPMTVYLDIPDATGESNAALSSTGNVYGQLIHASVDTSSAPVPIFSESDDDPWVLKVKSTSGHPTEARVSEGWKLKPDALEDIWIVCTYRRVPPPPPPPEP